jgi:hypothetical protein
MSVSMSIGPAGQPATTAYTYDLGVVTLAPRDATVRTATELRSITKTIKVFYTAVITSDTPVILPPESPLVYRFLVEEETPGIATCRFRCAGYNGGQNLTVDATQDLTTRITSFDARPERSITWGDFNLFLQWLQLLTDLATR